MHFISSSQDGSGCKRQRLGRGNHLVDANAFIDHRPNRDEAGSVFDAGDADAL